ncbi:MULTISPECIES: outer membrane protein assembly factor BamE [unclassified Yoonia]|uniref:outer membrane protein assembly factor BamE n=1 Tax=unclassified Yoonia TaxID=2629118 RepID=UPI002AFF49C6|nr:MULTISPECIES: outer membrane protein assembly factor BamE [unclassified Yoonia]
MNMTKLRASLRASGFVVAVVAVAACTPMTRFHGFAPDARELAQVQVGQSTRADVVALFGPPTSDGGVRNDTIYYVASQFDRIGPFAPREVDRTVIAVSFDASDRVRNVTRYTLEDGRVVQLDRRVTDDGIADVGVLEQLLGSFGRIDAGTFLGADNGGGDL